MGRISIAGVLGFVAVFAIGLAALVNATPVWAGVAFTLTIGLLLASVLAVLLRGRRRGVWLGFSLFGWGYFLIGHFATLGLGDDLWMLPDAAAVWIFSRANHEPIPPPPVSTGMPGMAFSGADNTAHFLAARSYGERAGRAIRIGHCVWTLLLAQVGAILGIFLDRGRWANDAAPASL